MVVFILTQVKHTNGTTEKGCVIKNTLDEVLQSYHAYLGAYAYGHDANTDYVLCEVMDALGNRLAFEVWDGTVVPPIGE
jgi:hypothetical protein